MITITTQPQTVIASPGEAISFTVVATGLNLLYQWQYKKDANDGWNNFSNGTNSTLTKTIPTQTLWDGWTVRCKVSDGNDTVYSDLARIYYRQTFADEYTRLQNAKDALKTSIEGKGVVVPDVARIDEYADLVDDISSGGSATLITKSISANGTYNASSDSADGYSQVTVAVPASAVDSGTKNITANGNGQDVIGYAAVNVNVPNSYSAGDEGKVVSNGALVAQTSDTVTTNDTYDTTLINSLTVNVSGGGSTEPEPLDVDLVDYDGTLLYTYTKADFLALDSLPANPSHSGLVAQGWNWTLADAKTYVTAHGTLVIGQSYRTDDGKTRFYISIPEGAYPNFGIIFYAEAGHDAVIAWGDGNSETVAGQTGYLNKSHTYNSSGDYVVTIDCSGNLQFGHTATNYTIFGTGAGESYRQPYLKKIEFSNNVVRVYKNAFNAAVALESISIPTSLVNIRDDSGASIFANCYNLKAIVFPTGCEFMCNTAITYSPVKYVSFPKMTITVGNSIGQFMDYCFNLKKLTLPDGISSAYDFGIANHCVALTRIVAMCNFITLGTNYYRNSPALPRIDIPSSVTAISANALNGNRGLKEIHLYSSAPPTLANTNAFGNLLVGYTIYVPYSADHSVLNAYKTATNWSGLASNIQEEPQ